MTPATIFYEPVDPHEFHLPEAIQLRIEAADGRRLGVADARGEGERVPGRRPVLLEDEITGPGAVKAASEAVGAAVGRSGRSGEDGELEAEGDRDLALGLAEALAADPSAVIASALDLDRWMRDLPDEDRTLLAMRFAGHTLAEIAEAFGVSISRVFARLKLLGLALAERAEIEIARSRRKRRRAPPVHACAA